MRNPRPYFLTIARFGELGSEYLTNVAYAGEFKLPEGFDKKATTPAKLDTTLGPANQLRAMAADALCRTGERTAATAADRLLAAAAVKINGAPDLLTIKAILLAAADTGLTSKRIQSEMAKYAKIDRTIQAAQTRWETNRKRQAELAKRQREIAKRQAANQYRTFTLADGQTTITAKFANLSDNNQVRLIDQTNNNLVIPLANFSPQDQKWLKSQD